MGEFSITPIDEFTDRQALKDYYDQIYHRRLEPGSGGRSFESYRVILDYLEVREGKSLLDVSCGAGVLLKAAEARKLRTSGLELSEVAAGKARQAAPRSLIAVGDAEELPFPNECFDYITNLGSLEHYLDPRKALREMVRACKGEGKLCIMVPNSHYLFDILHVARRGRSRGGTGQIVERRATLGEWRDFLESEGLEVKAIHQDKEPMDTSWRKVFSDLKPGLIVKRLAEKVLQALVPLNLAYQFVFVCEKAGKSSVGEGKDGRL